MTRFNTDFEYHVNGVFDAKEDPRQKQRLAAGGSWLIDDKEGIIVLW
jgi:hypothetical protein